MVDKGLVELADKMRNKTIAAVLEAKDDVEESLSNDDAQYLRKTILDELNFYHNFMIDLLESAHSEGTVFNERYLAMIEDIHSKLNHD